MLTDGKVSARQRTLQLQGKPDERDIHEAKIMHTLGRREGV
jgi:hypothetical protein